MNKNKILAVHERESLCPKGECSNDSKFKLTWKIILYILPIFGIIGVTLPLFWNQPELSLLGIYLAIPMISAPLVYLWYHQKPYTKVIIHKEWIFFILLIIYFTCLSISILILYSFEVRPFNYYILITIMSSLILSEILLFQNLGWKSTMILVQIIILFLDIVWGVNLKYHYFFGNTDIIAHNWLLNNLISTGKISDIFGIYRPFPLWHILGSFIYYISGISLPIHKILFFLNGIVYSFLILTTYVISLRIFRDTKIALISSLFLCINTAFIASGMYSVPRNVASFLGIAVVLLLFGKRGVKSSHLFLAIIMTLSITIYHPVSSPFILMIFLVIYGLQKIYVNVEGRAFITIEYAVLTFVLTLGYWMFHAEEIFQYITRSFYLPRGTLYVSRYPSISELFNYLQYSPLFFLIIVGVLDVLNSKHLPKLTKIFCMVGFLSITVSFPGPLLLIPQLMMNINTGRFAENTFLFISLTAAAGFANIYYKSRKYGKILTIILFISMSLLGISNIFIASDNPLVKRDAYTFYLTEEEITSFNRVVAITNGYLMSDYVSNRYLSCSIYSGKEHILEVCEQNMRFIRNGDDDVILIRINELSKRPLLLYTSEIITFKLRPSFKWTLDWNLDYYDNNSVLWKTLVSYNKIYDSGGVVGYG